MAQVMGGVVAEVPYSLKHMENFSIQENLLKIGYSFIFPGRTIERRLLTIFVKTK
ncbi:MAG: hypothetical protein PHI15_10240 [Methanomicrobium sp.]|nr:hypothetical protein [Methanomicrobium sp.]